MNSLEVLNLKELNLINVLENTDFSKIINKLSLQKQVKLNAFMRSFICSRCSIHINDHNECDKCKMVQCMLFSDFSHYRPQYYGHCCLNCLKENKFSIKKMLGRTVEIKSGKYKLYLISNTLNKNYENINYEKLIKLLPKQNIKLLLEQDIDWSLD